jgi:hypothetical membrane protein
LSTWNVVYERTKSGWSASIPVPDAPVRVEGETPEQVDERIREHPNIKPLLIAKEGQPTPELQRVDRPYRLQRFTNKIDWLGPGIVILSALYFSVQVWVAWVFTPPYNFFDNAISDLGATECNQNGYNFCSPRWLWMDITIGILGLAMVFGSILIFTEFRFSNEPGERKVAAIGFGLLSISGLGAILVACVPENLSSQRFGLHGVGTATTIAAGQLGILVLGLVLRSIPDWLREFMIVTSFIVLLAGITYVFHHSSHAFGFGAGALERIVQYPQALWLILFGLYISREHSRKGVTGKWFKFEGADRTPEKGALKWALRRDSSPNRGSPPNAH